MRSTRTLTLALAVAALAVFAPQALAVSGSITVDPVTGNATATVTADGGSMTFIELSMPDANGPGTATTYSVTNVQQPCNGTEAVDYGISCSFAPSGGPTSFTIPFNVFPVPAAGSVSPVRVGVSGGSPEQGSLVWSHTQTTTPPPPQPRPDRLTREQKEELRRKLRERASLAVQACGIDKHPPGAGTDPRIVFALELVRGLCADAALEALRQALAGLEDPPDTRYGEIALPAKRSPAATPRICRRPARGARRGCRLVARAMSLATAVKRTSDVLGALLVAIDRFETAQRDQNLEGQVLQGGVLATLAGLLADAQQARDRAEAALAAELRRSRIRPVTTSRDSRRLQRRFARMQGVPRAVTRALRARGYSRAEIRELFKQTFGGAPFGRIDFVSLLRKRTNVSAFEADHRAIRLVEIRAIVNSFGGSGAFNAEQVATLRADLDAADAAPTPQDRAAAVRAFVEHARTIRGAASEFLRFAAGPLASP